MDRKTLLRIYGKDYEEMTEKLLTEAGLRELILEKEKSLYGLNGGQGNKIRIGIKPNLVCPSPAQFGATTHPEIVSGIIRYLQKNCFSHISVYEGSWAGDSTEEAFEYCGYNEISKLTGVALINTKKCSSIERQCGDIKLHLCSVVEDIDFLINVPVLKGHCQTKMTCALKNMKGLIPDTEKRRFHTMGLHKPIAYLNELIHQDFIVVDDICGDPDFEEGGNPSEKNCILAGLDPVMIDGFAARELGWKPEDVEYLILAEKLGAGSLAEPFITDLRKTDIKKTGNRRFLDVSYALDDCDTCSACYASLLEAMYRINEEGLLDRLPGKIGIGQGMKGKTGAFGIGRCTSGFERSVNGCPPDPEAIYEGMKAYINENGNV